MEIYDEIIEINKQIDVLQERKKKLLENFMNIFKEGYIENDDNIIRLNYIGSKYKLLHFLEDNMKRFTGYNNFENKVIGDLFSGSGIVSYFFRNKNAKVISNDMELYSYIITRAMSCCNYSGRIQEIIDKLNDNKIMKMDGFIYMNYGPTKGNRKYFTDENCIRIDTYRNKIEKMYNKNKINENEYYFLLGSLLVCADNVANIPAVYGCFLKNFKKKALKEIKLEPIHKNTNIINNKVYNEDINNIIDKDEYDIIYLDPPYNQRQYSKNYHVLHLISLSKDYPKIAGITGLNNDGKLSNYCKKAEIYNSLKLLLDKMKAKYIFMSYNNEGLLDLETIKELFSNYGTIEIIKHNYKRFKSFKYNDGNQVVEYLICLKKIDK
jgi:adenine-specific DNA-methyltransferase